MKAVILLLMCFESVNLQKSYLMQILETKTNFFYKINSKIHTIINKILVSLKLNKEFNKSRNIQMLLTMHFYLRKIAEINCRVYEKLKTVSAVNFNQSHTKSLQVIFQNIVEEEIAILKKKVTNITYNTIDNHPLELSYNKTKYNNTEYTLKNFKELWSKISDKTIENITDTILNESDIPNNEDNSFGAENKAGTVEVQAWPIIAEGSESLETRRIYKGKKTKIKNYPFVASIHLMSEYLCAGSVISEDMIITAASCLQIAYNNKISHNPRTLFARISSDYTNRFGDLVPIIEVIFHPQYDSATLKHNLAILRLPKEIKSTKKKVVSIKYDKNATALASHVEDVTILGWGARSAKDNLNNQRRLAVAHLDIYDINDCKEVYSKYYVTNTNFCAGFTTKGGGACTGDVGGPAVVSTEKVLVGVVSFGPTVCGMHDAPTVFTKVGYYAHWIDSVVIQKSVYKRGEMQLLTTHSTSKAVTIPFHTTTESPVKPASTSAYVTEKTEANDYPDEINVLKKIIQEFILSNASVLDYLTNTDILKHEDSPTNGNLFLDDKNYTPNHSKPQSVPKNGKPTKISTKERNAKAANKKYRNNNLKPISKSVVKPLTNIFESTRFKMDHKSKKKTTLSTIKRVEIPEDVYFDNKYEVEQYLDESSSYYELDIPIEDSPFTTQSEHILGYPIATKSRMLQKERVPLAKKALLFSNEPFAMNIPMKYGPNVARVNQNQYRQQHRQTYAVGNFAPVVTNIQTDTQKQIRGFNYATNY